MDALPAVARVVLDAKRFIRSPCTCGDLFEANTGGDYEAWATA
jgi:hypothetical protein